MIEFLPNENQDFEFSNLFQHYEENFEFEFEEGLYPFFRLKYFYLNKETLPKKVLKIEEERIERFDMFKKIFDRGDYFYLIAYHYFLNVKNYDFDYKVQGMMKVLDGNNNEKIISFFQPLHNSIVSEAEKSKINLRHEYILSKNKYGYINKLTFLLLKDYSELEEAIRREKNVFCKYGIAVREVYISVLKDFHSNFVDYLSDDNFKTIKKLIYPSKKEVQSFRFAVRKNYRNLSDKEAKEMIINSIWKKLIDYDFVNENTSYKQIFDLFDNKRREEPKIFWKNKLTALSTFYKVMESEKIIQNTENQHWNILSDYFILKNGSEISREELKNKKESTDYTLIDNLKDVFSFLDKIVA